MTVLTDLQEERAAWAARIIADIDSYPNGEEILAFHDNKIKEEEDRLANDHTETPHEDIPVTIPGVAPAPDPSQLIGTENAPPEEESPPNDPPETEPNPGVEDPPESGIEKPKKETKAERKAREAEEEATAQVATIANTELDPEGTLPEEGTESK